MYIRIGGDDTASGLPLQKHNFLLFRFISLSVYAPEEHEGNSETQFVLIWDAAAHVIYFYSYYYGWVEYLWRNFIRLSFGQIVKILLMDCNFKLSVGMDDNAGASETGYTRVNFDFEIQEERINAITAELQAKTGKFKVPTIVFDFPDSVKDFDMPFFQAVPGQVQYDVSSKDGRTYKMLDFVSGEFPIMKKKLEKIFTNVTKLNNKIYLHIDLYNVDGFEKKLKDKEDFAIAVFLEKSKIQAKFSLDPNFFVVLGQEIAKVSPKFAESPIMAMLPLFAGADVELQLDSLNQLEVENQKQLFQMIEYENPGDDAEGLKVKQLFKNKDKVYIYFSFGALAVLKIELQVRMFAYYNCIA